MTAYDPDNIFAKILSGAIPSYKVYEDENALAIMDVFPQSRGHVLVIPKVPSRNLLDADPAVLSSVMPTVQRLAAAVVKATDADGFRLVQFNEPPAGQTVFYLHFHIIPAYEGKEIGRHGAGGKADDAELSALAKAIAAELA
ncbi:MAG TPA: HIT family protein [Devosiaceae bacterium]|nr:HIT family protein [Devosiaceae bacterium]